MVKKAYTLYLDEDYVEDARAQGYKVSQICNSTIRQCTRDDFNDIEESAKVAAIDKLLDGLRVEAERVRLEYERATARVHTAERMRQKVIDEYLAAQRTMHLARMVRDLNSTIISNNFNADIVRISCGPLLEEISKASEYFDLERHIERLKNVLL